jgi:DNA-binding NarL/FixJ family response regulator
MIKVAIVDDQKVVTQGLKALLEVEPDVQIIGTGSNGQEAIQLVETLSPDVLLIDQYMPVMDGVAATKIICSRFPKIAVLLLSGSESDETIAEALQAGAKGYLLKSTSAEELADSIRSVHRGYSQMGPGLMEKLIAKINAGNAGKLPDASAKSTRGAAEPLVQSSVDPLMQLLRDSTQFDVEAMRRLLDSVNGPTDAAELMTQIERKLQRNPSHVSALYLAGQLISEFNQHSRLPMNYLRLSYQYSQQQNFPISVQFHICRAAWNANSGEVFEWLQDMLKTWQPLQQRSEFFKGLSQVFAPSSDAYRLLKAVWEIQSIIGLCDEVDTLKPELNFLTLQKSSLDREMAQFEGLRPKETAVVLTIEQTKERSIERN